MSWLRSALRHGLVLFLATGRTTPPEDGTTLILATTTSTRDSGLLDVLLPKFTRETGIMVKVVAVGSGQALELGRRGDADVLLTHAPAAERKFMADGYGELCRRVMVNDFVLVGPNTDVAQVQSVSSIVAVLHRIAATKSAFVSRGDDSGTHMQERWLWETAAINPEASAWYIESGVGMAASLRIADEKQAYTLSDRGTFLAQRTNLQLKILAEGDPMLQNPYYVIVVSQQRHPHIRAAEARQFVEFLCSDTVQELVGTFGIEEFGEPLFSPAAISDIPKR